MKERLEIISKQIRYTLEGFDSYKEVQNFMGGFFSRFPVNNCKITSYIVLLYLHRYECVPVGDLFLIANADIDGSSHAWAKCNKYHIDITGDQFTGGSKIWVSETSPWPESSPSEHPLDRESINSKHLSAMENLCLFIYRFWSPNLYISRNHTQ
jgi:hypothetical protein